MNLQNQFEETDQPSAAIGCPTDQVLERPRNSRRWLWVFLALAVAAIPVALFAGDSLWRRWFGPQVDPSQTSTVTISRGSTEPAGDGQPQTALGGLLRNLSQARMDEAAHPLDPVLELARMAKKKIETDVRDYTARMSNEIRLDNGTLRGEQFMFCKIRHGHTLDGNPVPLSIYTRFLAPQSKLGQEAIWIEGRNDNNLVAHLPPGLTNLLRWNLHPESSIAMADNRYPITEMGILKLLEKMIEKGTRDREIGPCEVRLDLRATVGGKDCVMIEVCHPVQREPYDFHLARIYIDTVQELPIAYEGFLWPEKPGLDPPLLERYVYQDLRINQGLTDADFDPDNSDYQFPGGKKK